jgi:hypothetical protein
MSEQHLANVENLSPPSKFVRSKVKNAGSSLEMSEPHSVNVENLPLPIKFVRSKMKNAGSSLEMSTRALDYRRSYNRAIGLELSRDAQLSAGLTSSSSVGSMTSLDGSRSSMSRSDSFSTEGRSSYDALMQLQYTPSVGMDLIMDAFLDDTAFF